MTKPQRGPIKPTARQTLRQAAFDIGISPDDHERAFLLAQIADVLAQHPKIGKRLAFKGGTVMRLADNSPRLSRDLDAVDLVATGIRADDVEAALTSPAAKRFIINPGKVTRGTDRLVLNFVEVRLLSGGNLPIRMTIHWVEKPLCPREELVVELPNGNIARFTILARRERAAEKVRAFIDRALGRDAFDLWYFARERLDVRDWRELPKLIDSKLTRSELLAPGEDVLAAFDAAVAQVEESWDPSADLILVEQAPSWAEVKEEILRFRGCLPAVRRA